MTAWAERLAERSPIVQRSRDRSVQQARVLIDAARRLIVEQGESFTTQELVKEAGVALQTFYRYFSGKDELLLAVIEDMIAEACGAFTERAAGITDPLERLHSHLDSVMSGLREVTTSGGPMQRFVASQHWRLSALFPDEIGLATRNFTDLIAVEIAAANAEGSLRSRDVDRDAWLVTQLVMSVFHHHSFAPAEDPTLPDDLWRFCLQGLGATID